MQLDRKPLNESKVNCVRDGQYLCALMKCNHSWLCIGWHDLSRLCLAIHNVWYCGCRECIAGNVVVTHKVTHSKDTARIDRQGNVSDAVSQIVKVLGSRSPSVIPLYTAVVRLWRVVCQFVSWHSAEAVTRCIWLSIDLS